MTSDSNKLHETLWSERYACTGICPSIHWEIMPIDMEFERYELELLNPNFINKRALFHSKQTCCWIRFHKLAWCSLFRCWLALEFIFVKPCLLRTFVNQGIIDNDSPWKESMLFIPKILLFNTSTLLVSAKFVELWQISLVIFLNTRFLIAYSLLLLCAPQHWTCKKFGNLYTSHPNSIIIASRASKKETQWWFRWIVNGEWWMVNGEWWMVNGEWWMVNGEQ